MSRIYSYNSEIKITTTQFLDSLNNIIVKRSDPNGIRQIKCYTRMGTASRTFKFLKQPAPGVGPRQGPRPGHRELQRGIGPR